MAPLGGTQFEAETVTDDEFVNEGLDEPTESEPEASTGEEPEVVVEPEAPEEDGPERDPETGKFVAKKEGEPEPPALTEATPEIPAPVEPAVVEQADPFVFKVSGKDYTLEGAKLTKDGLHVPTEQVENAKRAIAEGTYYRQNWQNLEKQYTDKGYQKAVAESPEIRQAKAMMEQFQPLLADADKAAEFLSDFHANAPILRANAEAAMVREELAALKAGTQQQQESGQQEQLEQMKGNTLSETMSELRAVPDTKILTKEDWTAIDRQVALLNQRNALFVTQNGELYLDVPVIEEIAQHVVNMRKESLGTAKKAEEALKFNAANKPKPGKPGSAAVAPRKGGAPKPAEAKIDSRDVVSDFLSGGLDDDE